MNEYLNVLIAVVKITWVQRTINSVVIYNLSCFVSDFAENRLKLAEVLYYKVLENVMVQELKRLQGKDMSVSSRHSLVFSLNCCWSTHSVILIVYWLLFCVFVLLGVAGAGYLPLLPHGLLSGGGVVLLQLPEDFPLDYQRFQTGPFLLL